MTFNKSKRITWFTAILSGFFIASSIYFWFLQLKDIISRQRMAWAAVIWILNSIILFFIYSSLQKKIKTSSNNLTFGIVLSSLIATGVYSFLFSTQTIPHNLFLVPRQHITIEVRASESSQDIRLTGFFNGLSPVSYSSLKLMGNWDTNVHSLLRYYDNSQACIQYDGWMFENHFIEFENNAIGGEAVIHWNKTDSEFIQLSSAKNQKIKFDFPFTIPKSSKNSVMFITLITIFVFFYPIIQLSINRIARNRDLIKFDLWFEETTRTLQKFTLITVIISLIATFLLFLTPLFTHDTEAISNANYESSERPNVFLIIVDAMSAENMSLFGYNRETTPFLEKLIQSWTVFSNANTPSVCSIGVYPSLTTGHYPYIMRPFAQYGDLIHSLDTWTDLFQLLKQNGYHTYWTGYLSPGFYHTGSGIDSTFGMPHGKTLMNAWFQMKGIRKQYFPYIPLCMQVPEDYPSTQYDDYRLSQMMQLLNSNAFQSPFFMYFHFDGVHVIPGIEWRYPAGTYQGTFLNPDDPKIRDQYDEAILNLDYLFSKFIDELKTKGLYDQSMIIITADHGQVFRKGSLAQCSTEITLNETRVPLLIKYPNQNSGQWTSNIVSTIDLTPTILEIAGIPYNPNWFDGRSLLANPIEGRYIFTGNTFDERYRNYIAIMDDTYKLVLRGNQYFLFNYKKDPGETNNLMDKLGKENSIVQKLTTELDEQRKKIY